MKKKIFLIIFCSLLASSSIAGACSITISGDTIFYTPCPDGATTLYNKGAGYVQIANIGIDSNVATICGIYYGGIYEGSQLTPLGYNGRGTLNEFINRLNIIRSVCVAHEGILSDTMPLPKEIEAYYRKEAEEKAKRKAEEDRQREIEREKREREFAELEAEVKRDDANMAKVTSTTFKMDSKIINVRAVSRSNVLIKKDDTDFNQPFNRNFTNYKEAQIAKRIVQGLNAVLAKATNSKTLSSDKFMIEKMRQSFEEFDPVYSKAFGTPVFSSKGQSSKECFFVCKVWIKKPKKMQNDPAYASDKFKVAYPLTVTYKIALDGSGDTVFVEGGIMKILKLYQYSNQK